MSCNIMPAAKPKDRPKSYTLDHFEVYIKEYKESDLSRSRIYYYDNGTTQFLIGREFKDMNNFTSNLYIPNILYYCTSYSDTKPAIIRMYEQTTSEHFKVLNISRSEDIKAYFIRLILERYGERKILEIINPHLHSVGHLLPEVNKESQPLAVHDVTRKFDLRLSTYDDIPTLPKVDTETKAKLVVPSKPTPEVKYDLAAEYEKAKTLDAKLKEYPAVLGVRSQYMWAMINADREGDEKTALKYLGMLEKIHSEPEVKLSLIDKLSLFLHKIQLQWYDTN